MTVGLTELLFQGFLCFQCVFRVLKYIRCAIWSLDKICYSQTVPLDLKLRLFRTICLSVLLNHFETYVDNHQRHGCGTESFCHLMLKDHFEHQKFDKVISDWIYEPTGTSTLLSTVISRQLKFLGHRTNPLRSTRCMSSPTGEDPLGDRFSHRVQEWIDPKKQFLEDDIVRIA